MRKYYFISISIFIIMGFVIVFLSLKNDKDLILYFDDSKIENNLNIYQIDEVSAIYTNYGKVYYVDGKHNKIDLGIALENNLITIDEIIDKMNYKDMAMDGGSIVATNDNSKNEISNIDFSIIKCNKLSLDSDTKEIHKIKDIYIGDYDLENVCY